MSKFVMEVTRLLQLASATQMLHTRGVNSFHGDLAQTCHSTSDNNEDTLSRHFVSLLILLRTVEVSERQHD